MKVLRSGRHTQPSQVEKVAEKAGKAAPVMAISAGALVAVPHGHAVAPAKHTTVATAVSAVKAQGVSAGEAIAIAKTAHANSTSLGAAQKITAETTAYIAKHAKTTPSAVSEASAAHAAHLAHLAHVRSGGSVHTVSSVSSSHGVYSCSGLETLWRNAGGSSAEAFTAAEIAMAESGGNPNAISPTDDFGLWQINGSHGSMATLNPAGNARSAVSISSDGRDWGPWTTYTSGAYRGKC
jgi:uncharacterized protein YodC (DUF2158 family)